MYMSICKYVRLNTQQNASTYMHACIHTYTYVYVCVCVCLGLWCVLFYIVLRCAVAVSCDVREQFQVTTQSGFIATSNMQLVK